MAYKRKKSSAKRKDIHQLVTDKIIQAIEEGAKGSDWKMPWTNRGFETGFPANASTQNLYSGINVPVLWTFAQLDGYATNIWATYKQWKELGCQVRKGEMSAPILFYKDYKVDEEKRHDENDDGHRMAIRHYSVFNLDQVDGEYEAPGVEPLPDLVTRHKEVDLFVANSGAEIRHGGARAYYAQNKDGTTSYIQIPKTNRFTDSDTGTATQHYYATLLHELTHWTKHPLRLNRKFDFKPAKLNYAQEELVAELGASFLSATLKIEQQPREDHAQYIASWLELLKNDKKAIFRAAAKAQEASDYLYKLQGKSSKQAA